MKILVRFAVAAIFFSGIPFSSTASAQNLPAIDLFGGYSYFHFDQPASGLTPYEQLQLNGWAASVSVGVFHHLAIEGAFSGHAVSDCASFSGATCSDLSYMIGPRFTFGDRSKRLTYFVHGLVGRDQANLFGDNDLVVS